MKNNNKNKQILVTGGTGYIGSHTTVCLIEAGYDVTIVDNLCNSSPEVLKRIEQITGVLPEFHELDVRDEHALKDLFSNNKFDASINNNIITRGF